MRECGTKRQEGGRATPVNARTLLLPPAAAKAAERTRREMYVCMLIKENPTGRQDTIYESIFIIFVYKKEVRRRTSLVGKAPDSQPRARRQSRVVDRSPSPGLQ